MGLKEAIEQLAAPSRAERERGARVLMETLRRLATRVRLRADERDDAVNDILRNLLQRSGDGRASRLPGDDARLEDYLAQALLNWKVRQATRAAARLEVPGHGLDASGEDAPTRAAVEAERRVQEERLEARERQALGETYFDRGCRLVASLALALVERRPPQYRARAIAVWNELVDVAAGKPLDDVIRAAGQEPGTQTRNQRYTAFRRLRLDLLRCLEAEPVTPEDARISPLSSKPASATPRGCQVSRCCGSLRPRRRRRTRDEAQGCW
jgi:hypothetical protein